jgi:putative hydrolase of the HAD superfamily
LARINAVIFDLDNVLFNEYDYIDAAYHKIAHFLSKSYHLSEHQIYAKLLEDFQKKTGMYPHLFNDLLADLGLELAVLPEILKIYVNTDTKLELFPEAEHLLKDLKKKQLRLGLVTNGNAAIQRNKIRLLKIEQYFDTIVYARELGNGNEKPDPEVYRVTLETLHSKPEETLCIGDNPYTDFLGAKKLGIQTVRLLKGEFKDVKLSEEYEADSAVNSLEEFHKIITQNNLRA